MELLGYEVKRAHWGMICTALRRLEVEATVRPELTHMTPARFEILSTILSYREAVGTEPGLGPTMLLTQIIHKLGLDRSTIARSVRRMEKIGFVVRIPHPTDGRCIIVMVTELGLRAMYSARELLALKPSFIGARVRKWLGLIGRRDDEVAQKSRAVDVRLLAALFGYLSHSIFDSVYDHRTIFLESKFQRKKKRNERLRETPLLKPRAA